jgi:hypothetical protein
MVGGLIAGGLVAGAVGSLLFELSDAGLTGFVVTGAVVGVGLAWIL